MKKISFLLALLLFPLGHCLAADSMTNEGTSAMTQIVSVMDELKTTVRADFGNKFLEYSTMLVGIGAILYISILFVQANGEGRPLDLNKVLRPFIIGFIAVSYPILMEGVDLAIKPLVNITETLVSDRNGQADALRQEKIHIIEQINAEYDKQAENLGTWDKICYWLEKMWQSIVQFKDWIVNGILEVIFFAAKFCCTLMGTMFTIILFLIGPIPIGLSAIPAFSDAWKSWLAKYVWASLFVPLVNIVSYMLLVIEIKILTSDVALYKNILAEAQNTTSGVGMPIEPTFTQGFAYAAFMIGGIMMYCAIPSIASWVVNTSGGGAISMLNAAGSYAMGKAFKGISLGGKKKAK